MIVDMHILVKCLYIPDWSFFCLGSFGLSTYLRDVQGVGHLWTSFSCDLFFFFFFGTSEVPYLLLLSILSDVGSQIGRLWSNFTSLAVDFLYENCYEKLEATPCEWPWPAHVLPSGVEHRSPCMPSPRGSHIDVACRSVRDQDQNEIKQSMFILGADQGIKTNSERLILSDQRSFYEPIKGSRWILSD